MIACSNNTQVFSTRSDESPNNNYLYLSNSSLFSEIRLVD